MFWSLSCFKQIEMWAVVILKHRFIFWCMQDADNHLILWGWQPSVHLLCYVAALCLCVSRCARWVLSDLLCTDSYIRPLFTCYQFTNSFCGHPPSINMSAPLWITKRISTQFQSIHIPQPHLRTGTCGQRRQVRQKSSWKIKQINAFLFYIGFVL